MEKMWLRHSTKVELVGPREFKVTLVCGHEKTLRRVPSVDVNKKHQCVSCEMYLLRRGWLPEPGHRVQVGNMGYKGAVRGSILSVNIPKLNAMIFVDEEFATAKGDRRWREIPLHYLRQIEDLNSNLLLGEKVVARIRVALVNAKGNRKPYMYVAPGTAGTVSKVTGQMHEIRWFNVPFRSRVHSYVAKKKLRKEDVSRVTGDTVSLLIVDDIPIEDNNEEISQVVLNKYDDLARLLLSGASNA